MSYLILFIIGLLTGAIGVLLIQKKLRGKPIVNEAMRAKVAKATKAYKDKLNEDINDNINSQLNDLGGSNE